MGVQPQTGRQGATLRVSCSGEWKSMDCKDSPHSRLGDLLGFRICSMASNAQGVVVRAHIRALTSSRRAQQTTEHYVSCASTHGACSITAARGDLSNVCEATGWKTLGPLLFLGEVILENTMLF